MKDFKQQVADIKFWNYFMWAGIAVLVVIYVPFLVVLTLGMVFEIVLPLSPSFMMFILPLLLCGWVVGYMLILLAGAGVRKRKICSRCGTNLKIKELEAMGNSFLCPYCLNTHFEDMAQIQH